MNNFRDIASNIEAITREIKLAYNKGSEVGYAQGYKQGIADGNIADGTLEKKIREAYENGLKDAWNATRKIILTADDGGMIVTKIHAIFNANPYGVIKGFEAKEVIEKLKEENSYVDIEKAIDFAIEATDGDDKYSMGMRNGMRYVKSLIDGKEPEYESN
jgi:hypothetical protein